MTGAVKPKLSFFGTRATQSSIAKHGGIKYRIIERDYQGVTSLENALRRLFEIDFSLKEISQKITAAKTKLGLQAYVDTPEQRLSIY
jgi:hypothetical protein